MSFWKRTPGRRTQDQETGGRSPEEAIDAGGQLLLDAARASLAPLAAEFAAVSDDSGIALEAERAMDRLFAFDVLLRGAGAQAWRGFASFTINEAIARRDDQNAALQRMQIAAAPRLRKLQVRANRWAQADLTQYVAALPDDWFRFRLPSGQQTLASGVRSNCVHQLAFGVVALTSFDFADDADVRILYVPVEPLVPIEKVFALADT